MKIIKVIQIISIYIGAVIGAGFASGQEILQFFVVYGDDGVLVTILSGFLFSLLGVIVIYASYKFNVYNYRDLFIIIGGKKIGVVADVILTLLLLGSLLVMLSGSLEVFKNFFISKSNNLLFFSILIIGVPNLYNIKGIANLNLLLTPLLIFIIIFTGNSLIEKKDLNPTFLNVKVFYSAFSYTSYNLILAFTILITLTSRFRKEEIYCGIILGGIILGVLSFFIAYILKESYSKIYTSQIPMLDLIKFKAKQLYLLYSSTLWISMITTASCSLYALVNRISLSTKLPNWKIILLILIFIFPFIHLPFNRLVEVIYLQLGKLSMVTILCLFFSYFKSVVK